MKFNATEMGVFAICAAALSCCGELIGEQDAHAAGNQKARRGVLKSPLLATEAKPIPESGTNACVLPPALPGVTDLKFGELFKQPVGRRGLEATDKLRSLDGKRVRVLGYMVRQEQPVPHGFLLTPLPVILHEDEFGFCEDMPATVLHVFTDRGTPATVAFTPGLLLLTGTLSVGNRAEWDGRMSSVRLQLDPPTAEQLQNLTDPPGQHEHVTGSLTNAAIAHGLR